MGAARSRGVVDGGGARHHDAGDCAQPFERCGGGDRRCELGGGDWHKPDAGFGVRRLERGVGVFDDMRGGWRRRGELHGRAQVLERPDAALLPPARDGRCAGGARDGARDGSDRVPVGALPTAGAGCGITGGVSVFGRGEPSASERGRRARVHGHAVRLRADVGDALGRRTRARAGRALKPGCGDIARGATGGDRTWRRAGARCA